jgi:branched-subunit amino acid ABC-type transport system permease component
MSALQSLRNDSRMQWWEPVLWLAIFAAPLLFPSHALIVNEIAIFALFAVSLDLVLGFGGIVSLGHAAFFGLGAYTAALFCKHVMPDPHVGLLVAMGVAALAGLLASLTVLRGTDLTRLMVTLGVALILLELANKLDWLTGGTDGIQGLNRRSRPTSTSTTRNRPIQKVQYCGVICETKSCSSLKTMAPVMPPYSQPTPPITSISMTSAERWNSNTSSEAKPEVCVNSAPAAPAIAAAIA